MKGEKIVEICQFLKTTPGLEFDYCLDITAIDWPPRKVIEVVFHLFSFVHRHGLVLKVETNREDPSIATMEGVWKAASWLEREVYDLFGIKFEGHSDLRRIIMPADWQGHPLRKDYPLGYEEPQFSFNFEEIDVRKPYAKNRSGE